MKFIIEAFNTFTNTWTPAAHDHGTIVDVEEALDRARVQSHCYCCAIIT